MIGSHEIHRVWQLGVGAGMIFGFGSNALDIFVPDAALRAGVKAALIVISGMMLLAGYSQTRKLLLREPKPRELDLPAGY